ncbi:MAG: 2-amino-4-hydroxy-6-hydroxymethyldihydropteridine diphosphokinase [Proteiniphilum sp.]
MDLIEKKEPVFLALGSNLEDRQENIKAAYRKIEERIGRITSFSAFYYSRPVGFESEHDFVNSVCEVVSELSIHDLFAKVQAIEKEMGRHRKSRGEEYADRIIDIDLLLAGNRVINTPELTVPHPRMHLRHFVMDPLLEIAPEVVHPVLRKTIRELKAELDMLP